MNARQILIRVPKWANAISIQLILRYFETKEFSFLLSRSIKDMDIKRLLWLVDYFQIKGLQTKLLEEVIIQRVERSNCIGYLSEAYKKLKACNESIDDVWFNLLNTSLDVVASNISWLIQTKSKRLKSELTIRMLLEIF